MSKQKKRKAYRLCANISQIGSIKTISKLANSLVVDIAMLRDWRSMNFEHFKTALTVVARRSK